MGRRLLKQVEDFLALDDHLDAVESNGQTVGFVLPPEDQQSFELRTMLLQGEVDFLHHIVESFVAGTAEVERSDDGEAVAVSFPSVDGKRRERMTWNQHP